MRSSIGRGGLLMAWIAVFAGSALGADPATWPRFRGQNGSGTAPDKGIPVQWGQQNILWKKPVSGLGNSSPVVWEKRLFVQSASKDGKERYLICMNVEDGKTLWTATVQANPQTKAKTHTKNSLASSTPVVDGERVYALFWDGDKMHLRAYDMKTGEELWQRDLGSFKSQHGPGTSPMTFRGKVYVAMDQDDQEARLFAVDAQTGKIAWQAQRKGFRACYSVPIIVEGPGNAAELIVGSSTALTSYDPATGHENWNWSTWPFLRTPLRTVASPVYARGFIVMQSGDGSGERNTVAVRPQGKGTLTNSIVAWMKTRTFPYVPNMISHGDHLYFVNDKGLAACVALTSGDILWEQRLADSAFSSSPLLIDDKIFSISEDGDVYVFRAGTKFERLAKNALGEGVIATPAVADNRLFIRGKTHLFCIGGLTTSAR